MENLEPPWAPGEAWKKPARMIVKLLQKPDPGDLYVEGCESIFGCKHLAQQLFTLIMMRHGEQAARRIFAMWGTPPTRNQMQRIHNATLLSLYDISKLPVQRFVKQQVKANEKLPSTERRGARSKDPIALEKLLRREIRRRKEAMAKGTWWGPVPVD
jgi:hypothetical protein